MVVEDDGRGMAEGPGPDGGTGSVSMRRRAAALGGDLGVHSAPGQGTRVTVRFRLRGSLFGTA